MQQTLARALPLALVVSLHFTAAAASSWHVDKAKHRIVARPDAVWQAGDASIIVSCVAGIPQFAIRVRDPIPSAHPKVKLQFGGHRGRKIHFLGEDGIVREFAFFRGADRSLAIASAADSREIVRKLLPSVSRVAWLVDMDDGFDSLELSTGGFHSAWQELNCAQLAK